MPSYGVTIRDTATGGVQRLQAALVSRQYAPALGEAGKLVITDHFARKEADPSTHRTAAQLGARPVGLFAQFVRGTNCQDTDTGIVITIENPAIRQRIEGGEIRPVNQKLLTIPANAAAYGKRAREFRLEAFYFKNPESGLVGFLHSPQNIIEQRIRKRRSERARVTKGKMYVAKVTTQRAGIYYWLYSKVPQDPDSTVLPEDSAFLDGITTALDGYLGDLTNG